jgi:hypothetical protein
MVTFAVHFAVNGAFTLEEMAKLCLKLRCGRVLAELDSSSLNKLDEIASKYLDLLFLEAVGVNAGRLPANNPFSLVTVLQGDNAAEQLVTEGGAVHHLLEAITQWDDQKMGSLNAGQISSKSLPPNAPLLFGHARSRAVWDPERFSTDGSISLGCYHRNLLLSTIQAEALLTFAKVAEEEAALGNRPKAIRDCEDSALKRLLALHKGESTTYRSASLRRFIDDHPSRRSVVALAQRIKSRETLPSLPVP